MSNSELLTPLPKAWANLQVNSINSAEAPTVAGASLAVSGDAVQIAPAATAIAGGGVWSGDITLDVPLNFVGSGFGNPGATSFSFQYTGSVPAVYNCIVDSNGVFSASALYTLGIFKNADVAPDIFKSSVITSQAAPLGDSIQLSGRLSVAPLDVLHVRLNRQAAGASTYTPLEAIVSLTLVD